jgi:ribosomal silencing factor RsfS
VEQHRFELEIREARRIIREHNDNPDDFTFTRTREKRSVGHILRIGVYTVTVSRGKVSPATYEGGRGKNWVVLFAHDLGVHRFAKGTDDGADTP